jgi:hypothetical protein
MRSNEENEYETPGLRAFANFIGCHNHRACAGRIRARSAARAHHHRVKSDSFACDLFADAGEYLQAGDSDKLAALRLHCVLGCGVATTGRGPRADIATALS